MFSQVGFSQILIILAVVAVLFGFKRLPEIGKNLGKAINNFKRSMDEPDEIDVTPDKDKKDAGK